MGQNHTIELNGKLYDAVTGALLGESRIKATPASRAALKAQRGRTIDGFIRKSNTSSSVASVIVKPVVASAVETKKAVASGQQITVRRVAKSHLKPHQPERPKTLMRHVVKKPTVQPKPAIKATVPAEVMARPAATIAKPLEKKISVTQVNPVRLSRSQHIAKSHHIRRFNAMPAKPLPIPPASAARPYQPVKRSQQMTPGAVYSDFRSVPTPIPKRSDIARAVSNHATTSKPASTKDIFEAALAHATSHEQPAVPRVKKHSAFQRRLVNITAGVGAFLLIGGFIGYLNMNAIELRVASLRAGFHAQMPAYQPTGYALAGNIQTSKGKVAMSFRSGDRSYTLIQEQSDWNSATLLDQTTSEQKPIRTVQAKGRTIYIYKGSNATWVNGGVHYQISGNAPLDTEEIVALATSM